MANLIDYVAWRGDVPLSLSAWCEVDALAAATFSYLNFSLPEEEQACTLQQLLAEQRLIPSDDSFFPGRRRLFEAMASSTRFSACRLHHMISMTDEEREMQFSAMTLDLPDGTNCVAFRGTDNTLIGWREDFNMGCLCPVPAQEAASLYLRRIAEMNDRPIRLTGHSKGGNLSVYAASCASEPVQQRLMEIYTFDGPGLSKEIFESDGYDRIRKKIRSFVPQTSIVGMLMEYHRDYTVIHSESLGILQHDPLSWQIYGKKFEYLPEVDRISQIIRETLQEWLANSTREQRSAFVETLFHMADSTGSTKLSEITAEKLRSLMIMAGSRKDIPPETKRIFNRLAAQFVTLGMENVWENLIKKKETEND